MDDNIIADREYALELFRGMTPLRKRWVSQCSVLVADDPELLELMRAAGCCGLFIGIETASDKREGVVGWNPARRVTMPPKAGVTGTMRAVEQLRAAISG